MSRKCEVVVVSKHTNPVNGVDNIFQTRIREAIRDFKPDVMYVNGFVVAHYALQVFDKVVYDFGSFIGRSNIMEQAKWNYNDMDGKSAQALRDTAGNGYSAPFYAKEKEVIEKVSAIICWEGREASLLRKLYEPGDRLKEISPIVHKTPKPIPFEKKERRVMAIAAKWGDREKMAGILDSVEKDVAVFRVGNGGNGVQSLGHDELMGELNRSRVLFCPFTAGGIGTVCEGLKMGCNVVTYDWYPFNDYVNDEMVIGSSGRVVSRAVGVIGKAMETSYPPKKKLPEPEEQVDKILDVCKQVSLEK